MSGTMKTMSLTGIRAAEIRDVPRPVITDDHDVLIKMGCVGVCGSDVHYYTTGRIGSQVVQYPFTVGHEGAGIVKGIGDGVNRIKVGDQVAIDPAMPCHKCDQCMAGREHTCRNLKFLGCPGQAEGCISEYIVMPEDSCYLTTDGMSMGNATISEPLAIGLYAVKQALPLRDASIAILGSGPIGLCVLLSALDQGVGRVYVTDKIDSRLTAAKNAGAYWVGNPVNMDVAVEINALEPLQVDAVFECCGQQSALDEAVSILKPGGKLIIVGIPEVDRVSFAIDMIRRKEIRIYNIRRQVGCAQAALDLISEKRADVNFMITHRFGLEESKKAFDLVANYQDGVIKAVIDFCKH